MKGDKILPEAKTIEFANWVTDKVVTELFPRYSGKIPKVGKSELKEFLNVDKSNM